MGLWERRTRGWGGGGGGVFVQNVSHAHAGSALTSISDSPPPFSSRAGKRISKLDWWDGAGMVM